MATKKQWSVILSVAVTSSVAWAEPPAPELTLTLSPSNVAIVESVIDEVSTERCSAAGVSTASELPEETGENTAQRRGIVRSVLETPHIRDVAVPAPSIAAAPRLKAQLVSHGTDIEPGNISPESGVQPTGARGQTAGGVVSAAEMIRQRFPNGKPHVERWVAEDTNGNLVNHGKYSEFDAQGAVVMTGVYAQGKREGTWTQQIDGAQVQGLLGLSDRGFAGPFTSQATFKDGVLDGDWTVADSKGRLISSWAYVDGARHGASTLYNAEGAVVQSLTYKNNRVDGPARLTETGAVAKEATFTEGLMLRQVDKWYPAATGKTRVLQSQTMQLVPAPFNVTNSDWANNSITYSSTDGIEPIRHGLAVTFYSNGQRESEGSYDRGRRVGTFAWWYPNGQQKTVGEYGNDHENGEWNWWHENGMKQASGFYADGRKVQEWSLWSTDGRLVKRTTPSDDASQIAERDTSAETLNR